MLEREGWVFLYVVARDFGFAPNPFHGYCTLATCKPFLRNPAQIGDWVFGMGGKKLKAVGRCIYAMKVTEKITFDEYWTDAKYNDKRPVRNGSRKMTVGDNIYHFDTRRRCWKQADSHHSLENGQPNPKNILTDTKSKYVLISRHFYYFGREAPMVPENLLSSIMFKNGIGHRRRTLSRAASLVDWVESEFAAKRNLVLGDPFNFDNSEFRYSPKSK